MSGHSYVAKCQLIHHADHVCRVCNNVGWVDVRPASFTPEVMEHMKRHPVAKFMKICNETGKVIKAI